MSPIGTNADQDVRDCSKSCMAGSITFPGIGSGIDAESIARLVREQYELQNVPRKNQIAARESENSSLEQLRTLLLDVAGKLEGLRTANGGAGGKKAVSSSDVLSASADSTAVTGSYTVSVKQLATNGHGSFDRSFSSTDEPLVADAAKGGTVTFKVGQGAEESSFTVDMDATTTAQEFVDSFNASADGAATASLINVGTSGDPQYKITFSTTSTGAEEGALSIAADNEALFDDDALGAATIEQATNAVLEISGLGEVTRSSNTIDDVISGVTLQLAKSGSASVTVSEDLAASRSQLEEFIAAYNSLVAFVTTEDRISSEVEAGETVNTYGSLARTSVDEEMLGSLRNAIASAGSLDGAQSLASLGVRTERDGTLSLDSAAFEAAFADDAAGVNQTLTDLADRISGVDGTAHQFTGFGLKLDSAVESNDLAIAALNDTIARVERNAAERERSILERFSRLEGLLAKLNSDSSFIQSLFGG